MIDVTLPRECIYFRFEREPGPCPRCGGDLRKQHATYVVATWRGRKTTDTFIIGGDIGWFCADCPTVVINPDDVRAYFQHGLPGWDAGSEFALAGVLDLDAIPEDKRHLPIGSDDDTMPVVEFTAVSHLEPQEQYGQPTPASLAFRATATRGGDSLEERYEDVLQNIEFGIVQVYREHPEMTDWDALNAVEALLRQYRAEGKGRRVRPVSLPPLSEEVYDLVKTMCEWRLGRANPFLDQHGEPVEMPSQPISLEEIVACLKRVRKSIERWNRKAGRQGYLDFVSQFIE